MRRYPAPDPKLPIPPWVSDGMRASPRQKHRGERSPTAKKPNRGASLSGLLRDSCTIKASPIARSRKAEATLHTRRYDLCSKPADRHHQGCSRTVAVTKAWPAIPQVEGNRQPHRLVLKWRSMAGNEMGLVVRERIKHFLLSRNREAGPGVEELQILNGALRPHKIPSQPPLWKIQ